MASGAAVGLNPPSPSYATGLHSRTLACALAFSKVSRSEHPPQTVFQGNCDLCRSATPGRGPCLGAPVRRDTPAGHIAAEAPGTGQRWCAPAGAAAVSLAPQGGGRRPPP